MKAPIAELEARSKYIKCQDHPTLPLKIWNYTQACQFAGAWDEYTEMARGLITNLKGDIVARPFKKFFNLDQREETMVKNLPDEIPSVYEKMDGSLGILYFDGVTPYIATRGSFTSDQAIWASRWIQAWYENGIKADIFYGYTYLFEIIYPANRIVVNYGERQELVLLAVVHTETGNEIDHVEEARRIGIHYAQPVEIEDIADLVVPETEEGYVLRYSNGLRVKIKGEEYKRLHRILTGITARRIWELLSNRQDVSEIIERVPDEFYQWVKEQVATLESQYNDIHSRAHSLYGMVSHLRDRGTFARQVMTDHKDMSQLLFALRDDKPLWDIIWKRIKPAHEKPFAVDES